VEDTDNAIDGGYHSNIYSELEFNGLGAFNVVLSYGLEPFTGYWLDDASDDTMNRFCLTFKGYF